MNDNLSHTCWKCKYHIVFAPKYRRKTIYGTLKSDIGKILKQLCELKKGRNSRSRSLPGSYSYAGKYTTEYQCISIHGVSKGKKFSDDL